MLFCLNTTQTFLDFLFAAKKDLASLAAYCISSRISWQSIEVKELRLMRVLHELLARAVLAVIGVPILIICAYWGGWWLWGLVGLITVIALGEYYSAALKRELRPHIGLGYLSALLLLAVATFAPAEHQAQLMILVLFFATVATMLRRCGSGNYQDATANSAVTIFGIVYIGLLMTFMIQLRNIDLPAQLGQPAGPWAHNVGTLLLIVVPVWVLDTFAFAIGSAWGRRPLSPILSPRKTVAGALAGFLSCVGATVLVGLCLHLPPQQGLALGALLGIFSQLGDAAKSTIKRDVGLDDFGNIFGPHGGVLDRFDGLLFSMPIAYLYLWLAFLR